jgi:hypothetical protein
MNKFDSSVIALTGIMFRIAGIITAVIAMMTLMSLCGSMGNTRAVSVLGNEVAPIIGVLISFFYLLLTAAGFWAFGAIIDAVELMLRQHAYMQEKVGTVEQRSEDIAKKLDWIGKKLAGTEQPK